MSLAVYADSRQLFAQSQIHDTKLSLEFRLELPVTLSFEVSGKNEFDTEIDAQGNIVADKFVRIDSISIDNMPIARWILESRAIEFSPTVGAPQFTNYLAKNGRSTLVVSESTSFEFFLKLLAKRNGK